MPSKATPTREELLKEIQKTVNRLQESSCEFEQAKELLGESERKCSAWLEHSPVCTKIVDLDFKLRYMSNVGVKSLNIEDISAFYGMPYPLEFYPPDFRASMLKSLHQVMSTRKIVDQEGVVLNTNGDELWFHSTLVPVNDDCGELNYIMIVSVDVTERRRAEAQRVEMERQVQHAQKLESLGILSGGIAHDFNNIIMSVLGNADLALNDLSPHSPVRHNLEEIENASRRAAELAKQMLAYSGRGKFVIESIDLNALVEDMFHLLEVSISKKAELTLDFAADLPCFYGDATQVRQVVLNLITNASEALEGESGAISLSTGSMECDKQFLSTFDNALHEGHFKPLESGLFTYLKVTDDGCGMDEATTERIFDPFFSTKFTGRGLGMSAVLGIVRGHSGAINISTEVGAGTSFQLLFPACEDQAKIGGERRNKASADKDDTWQGKGTVLLADDEEAVCEVGSLMLNACGFEVLQAHDGLEAVEIFKQRSDEITCIILDLIMPRMDGEQAFEEIRKIKNDAKVILSSGYTMQDAIQRFPDHGLAGFIQKPYNLERLRAELMCVLEVPAG